MWYKGLHLGQWLLFRGFYTWEQITGPVNVSDCWVVYIFFLFGCPDFFWFLLFVVNVGFLLSGLLRDLTGFKDNGNLHVIPWASDEIMAKCLWAPALFPIIVNQCVKPDIGVPCVMQMLQGRSGKGNMVLNPESADLGLVLTLVFASPDSQSSC